MMTIDAAHEELQKWYDGNCVGVLLTFRAPRSGMVDQIVEETIKMKEMSSESREAVRRVFDELDSEKVELFKDKNGNPDRAKVVRRI